MLKSLLMAAIIAIPVIAFAQTQQPVQQSTVPQEFNLKLTPAEVEIVGKGLEERPFKEAAPLMQKLREQIMQQQQQQKPVPTKPPEKPVEK
jgi:hypothetical protein